MKLTKNENYIVRALVNSYEKIPLKTSVRFCEEYHISRAALDSAIKKCGFNSYNDLQNRVRFRCDIKTNNAINILYDLKHIVATKGNLVNPHRVYEYIYQMYCDLEESSMSSLDEYVFSELEVLLLDFENVFNNKISCSDIKQNIRSIISLCKISN